MEENRYRSYFEMMPCYLSVLDRDFRILEANRRFRRDFGDMAGRLCHQVYRNSPERCEECPAERTFRDGQRHGNELRFETLDGRVIDVIVYTTPIRNEDGEMTAVLEMATDITEIKLLQNQLRESREKYRHLFEEVPCHISIQDRDLRILEANRRFQEDFGNILGRRCFEVFMHRGEECTPCAVRKTFQDGQVHQAEEVVTSRSGEQMNVLVYTAPIRDSAGGIKAVMEMSANITQIRTLQSQLTSLGLVISSISHGIKGLLTSLDGGIYLVNSGLEKNNPERLKQGWEMVRRNVSRIRSMVLDLLYYAKDREPDWQTLSPATLVEEVCAILQSKAQEQGVTLSHTVDPEAGAGEADPKAIRSLLVNLMENALDACRVDKKKTAHAVSITLRGTADKLVYEIRDNGIGMDQETRERAFSLFFSSKRGNGTGLGLFISDKIAKAHGGSIALESEPNRGTVVTLTLPRYRSAVRPETSNPV